MLYVTFVWWRVHSQFAPTFGFNTVLCFCSHVNADLNCGRVSSLSYVHMFTCNYIEQSPLFYSQKSGVMYLTLSGLDGHLTFMTKLVAVQRRLRSMVCSICTEAGPGQVQGTGLGLVGPNITQKCSHWSKAGIETWPIVSRALSLSR